MTEPRHAGPRRSFVDRVIRGPRRPLDEHGRLWLTLAVLELAFVELSFRELPRESLAGVGWLVLALAQAAFFIWYVRRPIGK